MFSCAPHEFLICNKVSYFITVGLGSNSSNVYRCLLLIYNSNVYSKAEVKVFQFSNMFFPMQIIKV